MFPSLPSPATFVVGSFRPGADPLQSVHLPRPSDPAVGPRLPLRSPRSSTTVAVEPLVGGRPSQAHHRLRSQALTASQRFAQDRTSRACFIPQPSLSFLPSEPSPRGDRGTLSGSACSPAVIHREAASAPAPTLSPAISPTPASCRTRWPGSLADYGSPFGGLSPTSRSPWVGARTDVPLPGFTRFEAFVPPSSPFAPARVSPDRRSLLSWASAPLETLPPAPRDLDPPRPKARARTRRCAAARTSGPRDQVSHLAAHEERRR